MMTRFVFLVAAVAAIACLAVSPALAQGPVAVSYTQDDCTACDASAVCDGCGGCGDCDACCDPGYGITFCTCPGLEVGAEVVFLQPHLGSPNFAGIAFDGNVFTLDFPSNDYDASPRVWVGWVFEKGLNIRARWWQFDQGLGSETFDMNVDGADVMGVGGLEVEALDLEIGQQFSAGLFEANVGGGIRWGQTIHDFVLDVDVPDPIAPYSLAAFAVRDFEGVGPTMFAEFRRPVGCSGLALLANLRYSLLFGEDTAGLAVQDTDGLDIAALLAEDVVVGVGEIQLGAEYATDLNYGRRVFIRGMFEAQQWSGTATAIPLFTNDLGLVGFSAGIGLDH
jgi:hypothetical protein